MKENVMNDSRTLLLDEKQISLRINRLAYQLYEDNINEKEIILVGIIKNGYEFAEKISYKLKSISPIKVHLAKLFIDKHSHMNQQITLSIDLELIQGKSIILIDDVMNSGKTMMYALKPFLESDIKKIRTAVLIDRNHKRFPVAADFAGHSLSTMLKEHVTVEFNAGKATAWLS